jgi:hypothetical protein
VTRVLGPRRLGDSFSDEVVIMTNSGVASSQRRSQFDFPRAAMSILAMKVLGTARPASITES